MLDCFIAMDHVASQHKNMHTTHDQPVTELNLCEKESVQPERGAILGLESGYASFCDDLRVLWKVFGVDWENILLNHPAEVNLEG